MTVAIGTSLYDITSMLTMDDVTGTHMADEHVIWQYSQMVADATPKFYIEHLKRLRANGIQVYFAIAHVHQLEIIERLIRRGLYMGPVNGFFSMVGGGVSGSNPFDYIELVRRTPQGSVWTDQGIMRFELPINTMSIVLGQHVRAASRTTCGAAEANGRPRCNRSRRSRASRSSLAARSPPVTMPVGS